MIDSLIPKYLNILETPRKWITNEYSLMQKKVIRGASLYFANSFDPKKTSQDFAQP